MKKLSIIIPVYNTQKYLLKCINSCIEQKDIDKNEYEILIINDGSTDNSGEIIKNAQTKHPEIISVIEQKNKGLSCSRNIGVKYANGEYIWFVDSDDWIMPRAVSIIFSAIKKTPDGIAISYQLVYEDGRTLDVFQNPATTGKQLLIESNHNPAQFCIFSKKFLLKHNLRFCEGHLHEDLDFSVRAKYLANNIVVIKRPIYCFFQRNTSLSRGNKSSKRAFDCLVIAQSLHDFATEHAAKTDRHIFANAISTTVNIGLSIAVSFDETKRDSFIAEINKHKKIFQIMKYDKKIIRKIEALLISLSPTIFVTIYSKIKR